MSETPPCEKSYLIKRKKEIRPTRESNNLLPNEVPRSGKPIDLGN